ERRGRGRGRGHGPGSRDRLGRAPVRDRQRGGRGALPAGRRRRPLAERARPHRRQRRGPDRHARRPRPVDPPGRHRQRAADGRGVAVGRIWAAGFLLRRLRAERGIVLLLVLLVAMTSLIVAAAPRLYNAVADAGLRSLLADSSPARRNIALTQDLQADPAALTPAALRAQGQTLAGTFDPAITSVVRAQEILVGSPRFGVPAPKYRTYVSLRAQTGLESETELVAGRWPARVSEPPAT